MILLDYHQTSSGMSATNRDAIASGVKSISFQNMRALGHDILESDAHAICSSLNGYEARRLSPWQALLQVRGFTRLSLRALGPRIISCLPELALVQIKIFVRCCFGGA
jgi:hypothetical protein